MPPVKPDNKNKLDNLLGLNHFAGRVETLLKNSPAGGVNDMDSVTEYLEKIRSMSSTLAFAIASAEVIFAKCCVEVVETTPLVQWGKIKNSSTLTLKYTEGKYPNEHFVLTRLKELKEAMKQATSHFMVLIAYRRQEIAMQQFGGGGIPFPESEPTQ